MVPKWFYFFNHYLMVGSLGALLLLILAGLVGLPFLNTMPYGLLCWWCKFFGWAFPGALALFAASSGVVNKGFIKHRTQRVEGEGA